MNGNLFNECNFEPVSSRICEREKVNSRFGATNTWRGLQADDMAHPEVVESSGKVTPFHEEPYVEGWKKRLVLQKGGTATKQKKDVIYVAPDGTEVRNRMQLEKYLKKHPGGPLVAVFDWSSSETPRRSSGRLSKREKLSNSDSAAEAEPAYKRTKLDRDEDPALVVSPRKSSRRKAGPEVVTTGKDEAVEDSEKREAGDRLSNSDSAAEAESTNKCPKLDQNEDPAVVVSPKKSPRRKARPQVVSIGKDKVVEDTERSEARDGNVANRNVEFGAASNQDRRECSRPKTRGSRKVEETSSIPREDSQGIKSSLCNVRRRPWDPTDSSHVQDVKKALHLSEVPEKILCRDTEQANVIDFCKACIVEQRAGSIYICGCPGTGKSLTVENVKLLCTDWSKQAGTLHPEIIALNCTSLTDPKHIYSRVLQALKPSHFYDESSNNKHIVMKELKRLMCHSPASKASSKRMLLLVIDEMDYLITRDQSVLYEFFRLPTLSNSRLVLIGIANAIDLTDRLLPKLRSMNCKVDAITFPTYTKEQILAVLQQRLKGLPYSVFQPAALELCARKVAAATGDMRTALHVCRSAIELVQAEATDSAKSEDELIEPHTEFSFTNGGEQQSSVVTSYARRKENLEIEQALVQIDTMARALSRIFRSPVVETIQSLPRHQHMVLCAAVRNFRRGKKDSNVGELNTGYLEFCKLTQMQPLTPPEFSSVCQVLADQALLKIGTSREDRLRRVTLKADEEDVIFALQGVRFLGNYLRVEGCSTN